MICVPCTNGKCEWCKRVLYAPGDGGGAPPWSDPCLCDCRLLLLFLKLPAIPPRGALVR